MNGALSVCMIAKNENEMLPGCLDTIGHHTAEIVVVDNGSIDNIRSVGLACGCRVVDLSEANHDGGSNAYLDVATKP